VLFYLATKRLLANYNPIAKFAAIKSLVFLTYYQSLVVPKDWNNWILCIEMTIFALWQFYAFRYTEFKGGIPDTSVLEGVKSVLSVRDVARDAYYNFAPAYQEYVTLGRGGAASMDEGSGAGAATPEKSYKMKTWIVGNLDDMEEQLRKSSSAASSSSASSLASPGGALPPTRKGSAVMPANMDAKELIATAGRGGGGGVGGSGSGSGSGSSSGVSCDSGSGGSSGGNIISSAAGYASGMAGDATSTMTTMDDGAGARIEGGAGSSSAIQLHSVLKEVDLGEGDDDVGGVAFGSAMDEATVQDVAGGPSNL
jgi:hypothetical protein